MAKLFKPNGEIETIEIRKDDVLKHCQELIGGWVTEAGCYMENGTTYYILCDDEGLCKGLEDNIFRYTLPNCRALVGNILVISKEEGWN